MSRGEGTKKINILFEKYKKVLKAPEASVVSAAVEVIEDVLHVYIAPEKLQFNPARKSLIVKAGGPLKSEIMLHKKEIIGHLKGRLGEKSAPQDIL